MRNNDEIIEIIKQNLNSKKMSVSELSRRVGMAKSAVSRYMNKTREFPLNRADDFAKALNIRVEYLLGFDNESEKQDTLAAHLEGDYTEEELQKIREYAEFVRQSRKG